MAADKKRTVLSQDKQPFDTTDIDDYSPRYKHMPISLYRKNKYYSSGHGPFDNTESGL